MRALRSQRLVCSGSALAALGGCWGEHVTANLAPALTVSPHAVGLENWSAEMLRGMVIALSLAVTSCATMDVPMAHRGRFFDRTGLLEFFRGGRGFVGPVLGPGTYRTG